MIIDCHCHAGKGDGLTGPWDTAAPLEKYLRWAADGRHRPHRDLCRVSLRLCGRQPGGRAHRREPAQSLLRTGLRPRRQGPRA